MPALPDQLKEQVQRLIDLTAQTSALNAKIYYGVQPSTDDYDRMGDNQREYAELLGELGLRPPAK
ncbi:hypothetical protein ACRCPS_18015 [Pseudomonas aeruginosa]